MSCMLFLVASFVLESKLEVLFLFLLGLVGKVVDAWVDLMLYMAGFGEGYL